jgi:riboflavin kinase/FMN adenylyltransferase
MPADWNLLLDATNLPEKARRCALTIGDFDGVHLGHQKILAETRRLADAENIPAVAITFDIPPERILHPKAPLDRLTPYDVKCDLLRRCGMDFVVAMHDDRRLMALSPRQFVEDILVRRFAPRHVVEGGDFSFGKGRAGTVATLDEEGRRLGFATHVVEPFTLELPEGSRRVSSTLVREFIRNGRVEDAARCLGRTYSLYGSVVAGEGRGRLLEFPTANLGEGDQIVPADGVYAGRAAFGDKTFVAAISIGNKPTLGPAEKCFIEAFLIDTEGDFYHREMRLDFLERLRPQQKFADAKELQAQIAKDVQRVREICR